MTALAGLWSFSAAASVERSCNAMLRAQEIYAPEARSAKSWSDGQAALGRRLFRLLPEDRFDLGPVVGESGQVLVADVRLDNRDELLSAVGIDPNAGRQLSDASILMRVLERWDVDGIDRLRGDFAFALWDPGRQRLLLARDYLGQRPLHFYRNSNFVAFASMPKGLHALPEVPRAPDEDSLTRFLALMPETGTSSFFEDVKRVASGHVHIFEPGRESSHRYWRPTRSELRLKRDEDYVEAVREALDRAVSVRLRGTEGRVGAHLSAGLDSSAVASTAARLLREGGSVAAFTAVPGVNYDGSAPHGRIGDEGPLAAATAALYPNMEHVLIRTAGQSPFAALDRNFFLHERPVLNLCNGVWNDAILDAAKQRRLKVLLMGTMGNMSFSYTGLEQLPELLASGRIFSLVQEVVGLRKNGIRLQSSLAHSIGPFLPKNLWLAINRWRGRHIGLGITSAANSETAAALRAEAEAGGLDFSYRPRRDPFGTRVFGLRRVDPSNYLKGFLGGWGIDVRDPTADRDLVELCLSIPPRQYLRNGVPRALARRVLADRLPPEVVRESRKGLQAIDWHEGVRQAHAEVRTEVDSISELDATHSVLEPGKLKQLVDDWPDDWSGDKVDKRYRLALLRGVSGGHFLRKSAGSNR